MALNQNMLKCIELMITTNMQKQEIAEELGVRRETISAWVKREDFQAAIKEEMHREFGQMAFKARRKLNELVDDKNPQVALGAVKEVLNKAGYMETQKVEQQLENVIKVEVV